MSVFESVIGWLAPPVCVGCEAEGAPLCQPCQESSIIPFGERCYICNKLSDKARTCPSCRKNSPRHVWIATDYEELAKDLIAKYKFGHLRSASGSITSIMIETLLSYNSPDDLKSYVVVPIPTASHRIRERGFDHADLLSKTIASKLRLEYNRALKRVGQARQVGANRSTRLKQQENVYYVSDPSRILGKRVLLIDDIVTTGATLRSATKALRAAGARNVDALVFAKKL